MSGLTARYRSTTSGATMMMRRAVSLLGVNLTKVSAAYEGREQRRVMDNNRCFMSV